MTTNKMRRQRGSALIFMTALIGLVGTLALSGLIEIEAQKSELSVAEQKRIAVKVKNLLISYSLAYGRLPCPSKKRGAGESCQDNLQKGWLPLDTLFTSLSNTTFSTEEKVAMSNTRYIVYRRSGEQALDISALTNDSKPYIRKIDADNDDFSPILGLNDFCAKVKNFTISESKLINTSFAHVQGSSPRNVLVAFAVSNNIRPSDLNGNDQTPGLEGPDKPMDPNYKDLVTEISPSDFSGKLQCDGVLESVNGLVLGEKWIQKALDRRSSDIKKWDAGIQDANWALGWNAVDRPVDLINYVTKNFGAIMKGLAGFRDSITDCVSNPPRIDQCLAIAGELQWIYTAKDKNDAAIDKQIFSDTRDFIVPSIKLAKNQVFLVATKLSQVWDHREDLIGSAELLGSFNKIRSGTQE